MFITAVFVIFLKRFHEHHQIQRLTVEQEATEFQWRRFSLQITVLLRATSLVSNGNNIVACNFARFATNDVKGQQVATANGASSVARDNSRASTLSMVTNLSSRLTQLIIVVFTVKNKFDCRFSPFFNRYKQNRDTQEIWDFSSPCRNLRICSSPFCVLKYFPFMPKVHARTKTANGKSVILSPKLSDWSAARKAKYHKWQQTLFFGKWKKCVTLSP